MSAEIATATAVLAWADRLLRPAAARYEADGETAVHAAVTFPGRRVVPTDILVRDAIERYLAQTGELPAAIALSPLRLLSMVGYADHGYPFQSARLPLLLRRGVGSDEARPLGSRDTQELDLVR